MIELYDMQTFTSEQVMMRDSVLRLLADVMPPEKIEACEKASRYPEDAFQALARAGWLALPFDPAYGGAGASHRDLALFVEATAYHHLGTTSTFMTTVIYGGMNIQQQGTEALKRALIPRIIRGEMKLAAAYTEPNSGSDAGGITTRATRGGSDYLLRGQKVFITNAHVADYLVVTAKTDPTAGHRGLSLFLVDAKAPGVEVRTMDPMGRRTALTNEVFLDDVRVPATHLLGEENHGWKALMVALNLERLLLSASSAGQCLKIIEIAREWARDRKSFGHPITEYQAISHKFAEMAIAAQSARLHVYAAADLLDAGRDAVMQNSIAKVVSTEANMKCADLGLQIMGGAGYMEGPMSRLFKDARLNTIGGGSAEIMRNVIARQMGI